MVKNLGGRPKKEFDEKTFDNLCKIQCTKDEVCSVFECNEQTLTRWCEETYGMGFRDIHKKLSEGGKASLRRLQWQGAQNGNPTMLVWLGKQYLGQREKQEISGVDGGAIEIQQKLSKLSIEQLEALAGEILEGNEEDAED